MNYQIFIKTISARHHILDKTLNIYQKYAPYVSIIIVDGGPELFDFAKYSLDIKYIYSRLSTSEYAEYLGYNSATSKFVVQQGDDDIIIPSVVERCIILAGDNYDIISPKTAVMPINFLFILSDIAVQVIKNDQPVHVFSKFAKLLMTSYFANPYSSSPIGNINLTAHERIEMMKTRYSMMCFSIFKTNVAKQIFNKEYQTKNDILNGKGEIIASYCSFVNYSNIEFSDIYYLRMLNPASSPAKRFRDVMANDIWLEYVTSYFSSNVYNNKCIAKAILKNYSYCDYGPHASSSINAACQSKLSLPIYLTNKLFIIRNKSSQITSNLASIIFKLRVLFLTIRLYK